MRSKKYICFVLTFILAFWSTLHANPGTPEADPRSKENYPFRPGSRPKEAVRLLPWESLAAYPNPHWNKVIEVDGWLKIEVREGKLFALLYRSQESLEFSRPKSYLECKLDDSTIKAYANGSLDQWKNLTGKYVLCWGCFLPTPSVYTDNRVGWLAGPYRIKCFGKGEDPILIETPGEPWPK